MPTRARSGAIVLFAGVLLAALVLPGLAAPPANEHFERSWARTDKPVADGIVSRTWMWGPEAFTGSIMEPYVEAPNGEREVQYFDKTRKEITAPDADPDSIWYVTNGLLVVELITGNLQLGHDIFEQHDPASVNVAGDVDDPNGPTYQTYAGLLDLPPHPQDSVITQRINRAGVITDDPSLAVHNVTAAEHVDVPGINHRVASPFWAFMNSSGPVWENGANVTANLFENPYYATGLPITEAYWAEVQVAGTPQDVLTQCFERRCLTFNPLNEPAWQVEAGNVGLHYRHWRYVQIPGEVEPTPTATVDVAPTATATVEPGPTPATEYAFLDAFGSRHDATNNIDIPYGLAVGLDGRLYVVDPGLHRVQMYTADGIFIGSWGSQGSNNSEFDRPLHVAIDRHGNVYVTDTDNFRIQKFSATGAYITQWGSQGDGDGEFEFITGIAISLDDIVYVTDWYLGRVQMFNLDGGYLGQWGSSGTGDGEFRGPRGIAVDSDSNVYVADENNHRIQKFEADGTFVTTWGVRGTEVGEFRSPLNVAIIDGDDGTELVYVADTSNHRIQWFTTDGHNPGTMGIEGKGPGEIALPIGITGGPGQSLYVSENGNRRIQVWPDGGEESFFITGDSRGRFDTVVGLAMNKDGNLLVTDANLRQIQEFTPAGTLIRNWGTYSPAAVQLFLAGSIVQDDDGFLYISDSSNHGIVKQTSDGAYVTHWGNMGFEIGQFRSPGGLALNEEGHLYVVDQLNHRIQVFTANGVLLRQWGSQGNANGQFETPNGIAIHDNTVYVADRINHRIQVFDLEGNYLAQWGSFGSQPGQFNAPLHLTIGIGGYVYVSDTLNHRIQIFSPEGVFHTQFGVTGSGDGEMNRPFHIAVDNAGNVYVGDRLNFRVQVYAPVP
jgi:tripartite motif-containing protein 71